MLKQVIKKSKNNVKRIIRELSANVKVKMWRFAGLEKRIRYSNYEVDKTLKNTDLFFIISTGRSGTQLMSSLLNKIDNTLVLHEPDFHYDVEALPKSKDSDEYSLRYIREFRKYSIYERIVSQKVSCYGEVTGTLRYNIHAIQKLFPEVKVIFMVRDARDVIRSVWRYNFYNKGCRGAFNLTPQADDPYHRSWKSMTRFEKICLSWSSSLNAVLKHIPLDNVFKYEKMICDYEYFCKKILTHLGLSMDKKT